MAFKTQDHLRLMKKRGSAHIADIDTRWEAISSPLFFENLPYTGVLWIATFFLRRHMNKGLGFQLISLTWTFAPADPWIGITRYLILPSRENPSSTSSVAGDYSLKKLFRPYLHDWNVIRFKQWYRYGLILRFPNTRKIDSLLYSNSEDLTLTDKCRCIFWSIATADARHSFYLGGDLASQLKRPHIDQSFLTPAMKWPSSELLVISPDMAHSHLPNFLWEAKRTSINGISCWNELVKDAEGVITNALDHCLPTLFSSNLYEQIAIFGCLDVLIMKSNRKSLYNISSGISSNLSRSCIYPITTILSKDFKHLPRYNFLPNGYLDERGMMPYFHRDLPDAITKGSLNYMKTYSANIHWPKKQTPQHFVVFAAMKATRPGCLPDDFHEIANHSRYAYSDFLHCYGCPNRWVIQKQPLSMLPSLS